MYVHLPYHTAFPKNPYEFGIQWELVLLIDFTILDVLIFGSRVFFLTYIF